MVVARAGGLGATYRRVVMAGAGCRLTHINGDWGQKQGARANY